MSDYGKTIQLWPSGKGVEYKVEDGFYLIKENDAWRKATTEEYQDIRTEELAHIYIDRDVLGCDSCLVDDLMKAAFDSGLEVVQAFSIDEATNIYVDPADWTAEECKDWLDNETSNDVYPHMSNPWVLDIEELKDEFESAGVDWPHEKPLEEITEEEIEELQNILFKEIDDGCYGDAEDWQEAVRSYSEEHPQEPYEWWSVSQWLCDQLAEIGEVVLDNGYGCWWGRTCTGQGMIMDGTLQQIARKYSSN